MGELDVNILLRVYADETLAKKLTPDWRGGSYYAAGRKDAKPPNKDSSAHIGLFYVSKWATAEAAQDFAKAYAEALPKRYQSLHRDTSRASTPGLDQFTSADGPIFIQQTGNMVVVTESFEEDVARKLIEAGLKPGVENAGE
jgi:hypothetical protein